MTEIDSTSFTELTPLAFLERSAAVFPEKVAIVYGERRVTYREFANEATRLGNALRASGIEQGDRVAYLLPNIPEMLVAHFGVGLAGAVLVAVNTRLAPAEVRTILNHSRAKLLVVDSGLHASVAPVVGELESVAEVVTVTDPASGADPDAAVGGIGYDELLARGSDDPLPWTTPDERGPISINYTSGTTGKPKGVVYHHRGAYLNALGEVIHSRHTPESVYLWTLPMFHCNGWCTTWGVTAVGGTHVCLRAVDADRIWDLIDTEGVTHLNGAPTVLVTIANGAKAHKLEGGLIVTTAGAPPSPTVISTIQGFGATLVHVYGLTETYGPYTVCERQTHWAEKDPDEVTRLMARQGVGYVVTDGVRVVDADMNDVPRDGETMGEVVMRGNNVMTGYFEDPAATAKAFEGGWFHSGDLGVMHPDGYIQLRDRAKDIIVSGGENISTIEVEAALDSHPAVLEVSVIGVPDDKWGERPKAYVVLHDGSTVSEAELRAHAKTQIASYKVPDAIEFIAALPKTSTGKIQKFTLRERAWEGQESRVNG
ncbi:acyl--CoA ligase family protein [Antrihabitans sp. YC2-6]|uniref:acyl--CoA ligase family protein n=1 Tax=Antrihabitans sp. YC2-6 TaxID=2799498 RepID=UPI0018F45FA3|nr:acyl--CoA ligase family protein [Antrihabitans sp. YC2-6]MBJ8344739.1 long-chain-fatty-acid--CoA ligase [Antrihabitans sp. YC2-6]